MKIKEYKCGCGHDEFFFADKGTQKGIYCSYCGKWLKWADKNEQNLAMKQEPQSSLENPNKWIPVSERLPEKNVLVLVTVEQSGNRYQEIMQRNNYIEAWTDNIDNYTDEITAWMPLPEPYKASPTVAESEGE